MAIGGLVTGLVGLLFSWLPIVGLILGVLGVVLGSLGRKRSGSTGVATAGVVLGALAIVASIVFWVIAFNVLT
jgi:hypothetical protein